MTDISPPWLGADDLKQFGPGAPAGARCPACSALACRGWESLPGGFDRKNLRRVATLRRPGDEDPVLQEYHPAGTHAWSPDAPIAPRYFPYNRCDVWQCVACARAFLRYTEYGGYYVEERIRELNPAIVVDGER